MEFCGRPVCNIHYISAKVNFIADKCFRNSLAVFFPSWICNLRIFFLCC